MASIGLDSFALTAYLSNLHRESCTSYLLNDWDHQAFGPLSPEDAHRVCLLCSSQLTTISTSGEHFPAPKTAARPNNYMREITAFLMAGKWSFGSSSEAGHCTAVGSGPVSVAAFTRALSSELDAMDITEEVIRGQYLRASIFGDACNEMLQKIDAVPALAARVRNGSASFSDYASALYACIPVCAEAGFITGRAPFDAGFGNASSTPFTVLNAFCTILVCSAFVFRPFTPCNFGPATCPSRSGGC